MEGPRVPVPGCGRDVLWGDEVRSAPPHAPGSRCGASFSMAKAVCGACCCDVWGSASISVGQAQESIEGGLQRRRRGVLGPQECCIACIFVDDLNMPSPESSGAQPPVELLRQVCACDHGVA
jgi:hypothetical protein